MHCNVIEYQKFLKCAFGNIYLNYKPILAFCSTQAVYLRAHIKNRVKKTPGPKLEIVSAYI